MNLYHRFHNTVEESPAAEAIKREESPDITFSELRERARAVAVRLAEEGLEDGDRVAIYLPDCPEYLPAVLGCWYRGCVVTPLNTRFEVDELEYVLTDLRPTALIDSDRLTETADGSNRGWER